MEQTICRHRFRSKALHRLPVSALRRVPTARYEARGEAAVRLG